MEKVLIYDAESGEWKKEKNNISENASTTLNTEHSKLYGKRAIASSIAQNALSNEGKHGAGSSSEKKSSPLGNGNAAYEPYEGDNKKPSTELTSPTSQLVKAMHTVASQNKIG